MVLPMVSLSDVKPAREVKGRRGGEPKAICRLLNDIIACTGYIETTGVML